MLPGSAGGDVRWIYPVAELVNIIGVVLVSVDLIVICYDLFLLVSLVPGFYGLDDDAFEWFEYTVVVVCTIQKSPSLEEVRLVASLLACRVDCGASVATRAEADFALRVFLDCTGPIMDPIDQEVCCYHK